MPLKSAFTLILMGPAGSGKTTIGRIVATNTSSIFIDGDDFHPAEMREKMRIGQALSDHDRQPWLERLRDEIERLNRNSENVILACSALKESYRKTLRQAGPQVVFVYLKGQRDTLRARLQARTDHFFPSELLDSQLAILEEPRDALILDIETTPEQLADQIIVPFFNRPPRF